MQSETERCVFCRVEKSTTPWKPSKPFGVCYGCKVRLQQAEGFFWEIGLALTEAMAPPTPPEKTPESNAKPKADPK